VKKHRGFRFEVFWPRSQGYNEVVTASWQKELRVTNPYLRLHTKLERTSKALRKWARSLIGNNCLLLCAARMLIGILDVVQEFRQLSDQELSLKRDLKVRFLGMTAVEKLRAKQAARLAKVKAAEASSKLFYLQANGRRRKNFIQAINSGEETCFSHEDKAAAIFRGCLEWRLTRHSVPNLWRSKRSPHLWRKKCGAPWRVRRHSKQPLNHFSSHFGRPPPRVASLNWEALGLQQHNLAHLEEAFTEEEVKEVIDDLAADKEPVQMVLLVYFLKEVGQ
jgi:hypothetical protein